MRNLKSDFYKIYRFSKIYGLRRAIVKALGRLRIGNVTRFVISPSKFFFGKKHIGIIGCGQFSYSAISYFLIKNRGNCILSCYDIDQVASNSFAKAFDAVNCQSSEELLSEPKIDIVYIASNHYSHTEYAINCLKKGLDVYVEKPIAVNYDQLYRLRSVYESCNSRMFVGYNRPFSEAVCKLVKHIGCSPITLSCTIIGHKIDSDHWYRRPNEGSRICGNVGHWIDLSIHLLASRKSNLPNAIKINISHANDIDFDDNINICMSTDFGDIIILTMTSREEPYEGINETIIFQQEGLFVKIDDFKTAEFQLGASKSIERYSPKDVGHHKAIMQPFNGLNRDINEIFLSTDLMIFIKEMVVNNQKEDTYTVKVNK